MAVDSMRFLSPFLHVFLWIVVIQHGHAKQLYTEEDQLVILSSETLKKMVTNSSSAWVVQLYLSWCGHCIRYSPTWKVFAEDVKDWSPAISIGVLDCSNEKNLEMCRTFRVHHYPAFMYFKAHCTTISTGVLFPGSNRAVETVRHLMVDFLQNHTRQEWPVACPLLESVRMENIQSLFGLKSDHYTAVIIEDEKSYIGREVILDLIPYEGVVVKRALNSDKVLMDKLGITTVPAVYIFYPNGTHASINVQKKMRFFFSSILKLLPGVLRKPSSLFQQPEQLEIKEQKTSEILKEFDKSTVYMVDLESGLHYLLRVELATRQTLNEVELKILRDLVTVLYKLFPGRKSVNKLLETLLEWLISLPLNVIPYQAIVDLTNNKMKINGLHLSDKVQWVGCQSSSLPLRGYPCSLWTLFHVLTVQAASRPDALANTALEDDPLAVLQTIRKYIATFFGCRMCGRHFELMARESMSQVKSLDEAVLWLWKKHNHVNARLTGTINEDPMFPKTQWPPPELCPACHEENSGLHVWNEEMVLAFLKKHYSSANISLKYTSELNSEANAVKANKSSSSVVPDKGLKPSSEGVPRHMNRTDKQAPVVIQKQPNIPFLGFSGVDMSLCALLYALSCIFLMLMFFFFRFRSKRWKIKNHRSYV